MSLSSGGPAERAARDGRTGPCAEQDCADGPPDCADWRSQKYGGERSCRWNAMIKAFSDRLKAARKPTKVVIVRLHAQATEHHERHAEDPTTRCPVSHPIRVGAPP
jgi:hypothetical protein